MDYSLSDEQKAMVDLMKDFCQREVDRGDMARRGDLPLRPDMTREELSERIPWEIVSKAHDIGLRQLTVPKEYGGGGYGGAGGWVTLTAMSEAAGYYGGEIGRIFTIPWKSCHTMTFAPKRIQDIFFPKFMNNRKTLCGTSISEPNHGGDFFLPYDEPGVTGKYFAHRDGEEWVLNGDKMYCTAGGLSDYVELAIRTKKDGPITESMTLFLLPTDTPGVSFRVNDFHANDLPANVSFHFDNVRLHERYMISEENQGFKHMKSDFGGLSMHLATRLGAHQKIWEDLRDFSKTRIQGNRPIIQHPNVGALIAEGDLLIRTARLLFYKYAWECDQLKPGDLLGENESLMVYYCHAWLREVTKRLAHTGLEVYAGMGVQKDLPFERWLRVGLTSLHGGSTATFNLIKSSKIIGRMAV
jgi:alkylation response protein AidB-like acyl-CoA dehydrogenase